MSTEEPITHTIYVRVRERKKRFLVVSVPALHVEPGEMVQWRAAHGQGPFDIKFDKETVDSTPFNVPETGTDQRALTIENGTGGKCFAYSIYLRGEATLCLDPQLIVEKP